MTKPLVVSIPHQLGRVEAKRRLQDGVANLKQAYGSKVAVLDERWTDDRLDFRVTALTQTVVGAVTVGDDQVTLAMQLPWVLAMLAEKARNLVQKQGHLMLEKK